MASRRSQLKQNAPMKVGAFFVYPLIARIFAKDFLSRQLAKFAD
jgi:hypothetical protein